MSKNLDALMQYIRQPATDYAYMLTGPWGCGKTHFWSSEAAPAIAKYYESGTESTIAYVSLYGVRRRSEVLESVLVQLHPVIARAGRFGSLVAKSAAEFFGLARH